MDKQAIQVLLVDDDEDDYIITSELLEESQHTNFELQWVDSYQDAISALENDDYDVYLIDYRLGQYSGFDIVKHAIALKCKKPLILLTGQGDHAIEVQALELGASDYLVKGQFSSELIERSILYAIRHKQTLNSLEESEARYRAVIESQQELICRFTPGLILTFVNGAYCNYFNKSPNELIGQTWLTLVPESQHNDIKAHIADLVRKKQPITYEHKVLAPDGKVRWQQWTDQVVLAEDGSIELQSVGVDITDRKEAELVLQEALKREQELNELKSRFVSMASHEFRTPLAKIMGMASFLEMTEHKIETQKRILRLQKIQKACRDMTALLDDVLLYGKAEAERLEFIPEPIDLVTFINTQIEDLQVGHKSNHSIAFNYSGEMIVVEADEKLLRQIINNLLSNAVKYSPDGCIITIDLNSNESEVRLMIQDQGMGIPLADQTRLFEPFHRAKNARNVAGTGLGLAITAKAVQMHNGSIDFQSEEGVGTSFIITLPLLTEVITS